jgi:hypothetical protein
MRSKEGTYLRGIRSFGSFHGNMLTSAFGAVSRSGGMDEPVTEIVPNTQPDFARPSVELRLGRRVWFARATHKRSEFPTREVCLAEAAKPRRRTSTPAFAHAQFLA